MKVISENSIKKLTIYDIQGKLLIEKSELQKTETIDVSNFDSGVLIIGIQTITEDQGRT